MRANILVILTVVAVATGCRSTGPRFNPRAGGTNAATQFTAVTNELDSGFLKPPTDAFRLGPGDGIEIEILGETGTRGATFVSPDGKIYYNLAPGLDVWGLTVPEAQALLERELAAFYRRPRLAVTVREVRSKRVWVLGRLNKSGVYSLSQPMTVVEAISRAGGLFTSRFTGTTEELADLEHSFLVRQGAMVPINFRRLLRQGDMSQNVYLQADDFLYLPSALSSEVYVIGAVRSPRPLGFVDSMTLAGALAKVQGAAPDAYLQQVVIVRGSLSEPKVALVNLQAILTGRASDVPLQPHDIVYVPNKPWRTLERYANIAVNSFVSTWAANEGGRAASSSFQGIGVSNPIGQ